MTEVNYPFVPKSTAYLMPGQFWSIPLSNRRYACGRVLQLDPAGKNQRAFIAGLLDWCGNSPPAFESIAGAALLDHGEVHIKTIAESGCEIIGVRPLEIDGIDVPLSLDESPGPNCHLRQRYIRLGLATNEQQENLRGLRTCGYGVLSTLAEKHFISPSST